MEPEDRRLAALAALNEPLRRRVYRYVVAQEGDVRRDDVAAALGLARSVAAFHLDKLAALELLDVDYRRPPGRNGPGAGRPAKWYRRAMGEITLSVPERHYQLAADLLARAVEDALETSIPVADALRSVARDYGRALGSQIKRSRQSSAAARQLVKLLADSGYEPRRSGKTTTLANCPFHVLAEGHRALVCGMNHELIKSAAAAAGVNEAAVCLDPAPGRCCVILVG